MAREDHGNHLSRNTRTPVNVSLNRPSIIGLFDLHHVGHLVNYRQTSHCKDHMYQAHKESVMIRRWNCVGSPLANIGSNMKPSCYDTGSWSRSCKHVPSPPIQQSLRLTSCLLSTTLYARCRTSMRELAIAACPKWRLSIL